jgi:hypothetical protein
MSANDQFLGIVQIGQFHILMPARSAGKSVRLTGIPMQAAMSPQSVEIDLSGYEGRALMVRGHDGGGWIYSAEVIDEAGPILTAVVQRVFGKAQS